MGRKDAHDKKTHLQWKFNDKDDGDDEIMYISVWNSESAKQNSIDSIEKYKLKC